ncbi:hypothetical protein U1Q18_036044, partial [Sarracenia purpurea var. burkii]
PAMWSLFCVEFLVRLNEKQAREMGGKFNRAPQVFDETPTSQVPLSHKAQSYSLLAQMFLFGYMAQNPRAPSTPSDLLAQTSEPRKEPPLKRMVNGSLKKPMMVMAVLGSRELLLLPSESTRSIDFPTRRRDKGRSSR